MFFFNFPLNNKLYMELLLGVNKLNSIIEAMKTLGFKIKILILV